MLRVLGNPKRLCTGVTRRDLITAGAALGLNLPAFLRAEARKAPPTGAGAATGHDKHFGRAKACILLFLYGSPSQIELADQKPDAPVEVRGELKSIRSTLPGCDVCELLPHTSRVMHNVTVVRSVTHPYPIHGVAYATTSIPEIDVSMELAPHDSKHWPFIGSTVAHLEQRRNPASTKRAVPDNIALPFPFSSQRTGEVQRAGPYPAFLGNQFHPHYTSFHGKATAKITKTLTDRTIEFDEPYAGISPDSYFALGGEPVADLTLDRMNTRKSLLDQMEDARRARDGAGSRDHFREMAYSLISSNAVRHALDVRRESAKTRESYGHMLFGQSCLAARRLVEAGSKFVTVFWDEFGLAGSGWDTHWEHYPRMRNELMPGFDRGFSGLISDLDQRGMLDDTLVMVLSEHGRTPKLSSAKGAGRDHWSQAYSVLLAGGGIARGKVVGKTDKIGGTVADRPVSPKDLLATAYHLLGYDLETTIADKTNRPVSIVPTGQVLRDVLA
ncbi:arylsulfatase a family protein : Arylsulfatase A family protein OS=Singulisphaera acidiphila (strain ATCC BAA-1392 / DSM 18658 / VKM B-2454 / MOB10) GN=Sinac_4861 PE=4 SV=1: DUF1501 [Gemmata massiliana]|uniref:DUF1501 domain-containing protein n=1 Tax=Gemmata massiliana TaxID=1210884 RepID=A0A6P2CQ45_9BACT|nr:DUF1501 domain-containing protein [Gemmata massiliana]VTR91138.1 arylsulfatase a family protein : Arylsulfatase A family protein OS=Singulisphaera acidiphila (strain ATCC BAA-1392 / DSM 18658 / VKM B-2454 / MOB10) GN=Sinac_4861 PE=4 SV=1: DUF1501 [Gemmata massiliana]